MEEIHEVKRIDRLIRMGLLILLVGMSLVILAPFFIMLIWGVIIAVSLFPLFKRSVKLMGNRKTLTAVLFTLLGLLIIVVPTILLTESSINGYQNLKQAYYEGSLTIPAPTEDVKDWPMIGEKLYVIWDLAAHNLKELLNKYSDQVQSVVSWLLNSLTSLGVTLIEFVVSIIIAGVLLSKAEASEKTVLKFAKKLVDHQAEGFAKLVTGTIRSVVQGVLGIAVIQALASGILFGAFGIPAPGLWAMIILVLAIMQLPPLLVLGPIAIYVFSEYDTLPASIFTVFAVIISISDSLLKPVFLGRGVDIPMLVVLLGAIGGMLVFGILGLFVGAVVLALSYKLMLAWLDDPR